MKYIIFFIGAILSLFSTTIIAQDRTVLLVHGLGGDDTSWSVYEAMFNAERQMVGVNTTYNTDNGTTAGAQSFRNQIPANLRNPNSLALGHSMGGVTIREMDRQETQQGGRTFNAFVTCGSPNHGTRLVNSFQNGELEQFFTEACERVITRPLASLVLVRRPAAQLINAVSPAHEWLCGGLYGQLTNSDELGAFNVPTMDEMRKDNNNFLNAAGGLNDFQSSLPHIALWGNENSPVHWRFLSSLIMDFPTTLAPNEIKDNRLPDIMRIVRGVELAFGVTLTVMSIGYAIAGFWNPVFFALAASAAVAAVQFYRAVQWLDRSETAWNHLIGSDGTATITTPVRTFICRDEIHDIVVAHAHGQMEEWEADAEIAALYANPDCYVTRLTTQQVYINGISDGLVDRFSAQMPTAINNVELQGVNHEEFLNHPTATNAYRAVFGRLNTNFELRPR